MRVRAPLHLEQLVVMGGRLLSQVLADFFGLIRCISISALERDQLDTSKAVITMRLPGGLRAHFADFYSY